ncbi:tetratricopeptide repeat protein [Nonlabens sp. SCSIO 43208]|uniref:tetratricopeptide repeat-containing sensor histidine kinase n=1 Tax=Nonlabens sp. SCSIO 43208 TaxID=2793009 RepID=UPI003D6B8955
MKSTTLSFLFFTISLLLLQPCIAQVSDSLQYYSKIVNNPKKPDDLAKAFTFFTIEKRKYAKDKKMIINEIHATQLLAEIQKKLGYSSENEKLNLESLNLLEQLEHKTDWTHISYLRIINELGIIYRERKDYAQAIKLYQEGLSRATSLNHQSVLLNNIGHVYESTEEFEKALDYYQQAYDKAVASSNKRETARSLSNMSFIKSKLNLPKAENGLLEALDIRKTNKYNFDLSSSYNHLARFYYEIKDTISANLYTDKFLQLALKNKKADHLQSALRLKIETGQSQYAKRFITINDSINNLKKTQRNNFNYYVYQYDKKERDLQKSQLISERLLYLLLFIALASLSLYFILKYKHKKEKLQEVYNTETRISRKIHDEVANDVYHVMTQLQTGTKDNKDLLDNLENIYYRTRDISKQNSIINFNIPYNELLTDLFLSYQNDQVNIITKGLQHISWERLNNPQKTALYRVLQELLTNMKKHSHASIVVLNFEEKGKSLSIIYKDNGVGSTVIKGSGLHNTENRMHSINGTITFESQIDKGFKATIMI